MYTRLDDIKHASKINGYIQTHPNANKQDITTHLYTNYHRLQYLINEGLINGFNGKNT